MAENSKQIPLEDLHGLHVGVIGMGLMGRPMALNLHKAGAQVTIASRSPGPVAEMTGKGLNAASTPCELVAVADIIIIMVSDTPAVEAVLFGDNGLASADLTGKMIIDMGTTAVTASRAFAAKISALGAAYMDAPVSGGTVAAENGTLTIMAGGSTEAFVVAESLFKVLGHHITHVGDVGAGQVAKTANQVIVGLTIGALSEALALAKQAGVDPALVRQAIMGGFAHSRVLELHGQRMVEGNFTPGGKVTTQRKDMAQALDLAESLSINLPATRLNKTLYDKLVDAGDGELDHAALYRLYDQKG